MVEQDIGRRIADRLLQLRLAEKLTQEQLAERADIDSSVISRVERGYRTNIRLTTLDKLVQALGVDYTALFTFTDDATIQKRITSKISLIKDEETLQTLEKLIDLLVKK